MSVADSIGQMSREAMLIDVYVGDFCRISGDNNNFHILYLHIKKSGRSLGRGARKKLKDNDIKKSTVCVKA